MSAFANKLLEPIKVTLRQAGVTVFDDEIKSYIDTCAEDLKDAGILSTFFIVFDGAWEVNPRILQAVRWYCLSSFGLYNEDMEKYAKAYASLKATLCTQRKYTKEGHNGV